MGFKLGEWILRIDGKGITEYYSDTKNKHEIIVGN